MAKPLVEALVKILEEELASVPFRPYTLLQIARKEMAVQTAIKWNVNVGGAASTGRATTDDTGADSGSDVVKLAELPIGSRVINYTFSLLKTEIKDARTGGIRAVRNLFASEMRTAMDIILPQINQVMYSGDGTADATHHGVYGLESVVASAGAYAGIDPAVDTGWVSVVNTNGTARLLTPDLMRTIDVGMQRVGSNYNLIVTTPELVQVYAKLFESNRALTVQNVNGVADLDFSGYNWGGIPLVRDIHCPAGTIYFLDSSQLQLYSFDMAIGNNDEIAVSKNVKNNQGIQFMVAQLPNNNPLSAKFEVLCIVQLKYHNRIKAGKINQLTETLASYT